MVIVPDARPATMGILNTRAVGMSGAVTSATKVATDAAETSARTMRVPRPGPGSTESPQAPRTKTDASANDGMLNREQDIEKPPQGRHPRCHVLCPRGRARPMHA